MKFEEYEQKVLKHAFYPEKGANLPYAALGLAGEAGEVANIVKKVERDDGGVLNPDKRQMIKDELGDVLWYIAACAGEAGFTLAEIAEYNIEKLSRRHGTNKAGDVRHIRAKKLEFVDGYTQVTQVVPAPGIKQGDVVVVRNTSQNAFTLGMVGVVESRHGACSLVRCGDRVQMLGNDQFEVVDSVIG